MAETKVLELINGLGVFPQRWEKPEDVDQGAISDIQNRVLGQLSAKDIAEHNCFAYSNSVEEYGSKPVNKLAVPEISNFINLMPEDGLVLDLGAGHLRDTFYMVDPKLRDSLNREGMVSPDNEKSLRVVPLEKSFEFLTRYSEDLTKYGIEAVPLIVEGDFMAPGDGRVYRSRGLEGKELCDVFTEGNLSPVLDGIWSCAAYMVHMAPNKLGEATKGWAKTLKSGGVFAVSYINRKDNQDEMKFLASRSAPGEVKIFSHYNNGEVDEAFGEAGLKLIDSSTGDYDWHGHVMSDFFGSVMYRKE